VEGAGVKGKIPNNSLLDGSCPKNFGEGYGEQSMVEK